MEEVKCICCESVLELREIRKRTSIVCKCGCLQMCLGVEGDISRWRVMNPESLNRKVKK